MTVSESIAAASFYIGLIALCAGAVSGARSAVEKKRARSTIPLLSIGAIGIACALVAYARGPHDMLPF